MPSLPNHLAKIFQSRYVDMHAGLDKWCCGGSSVPDAVFLDHCTLSTEFNTAFVIRVSSRQGHACVQADNVTCWYGSIVAKRMIDCNVPNGALLKQ